MRDIQNEMKQLDDIIFEKDLNEFIKKFQALVLKPSVATLAKQSDDYKIKLLKMIRRTFTEKFMLIPVHTTPTPGPQCTPTSLMSPVSLSSSSSVVGSPIIPSTRPLPFSLLNTLDSYRSFPPPDPRLYPGHPFMPNPWAMLTQNI